MTTTTTHVFCLVVSLGLGAGALADSPILGGEMKHIMVWLDGGPGLACEADPSVPTPEFQNYGHSYAGGAAVLNDTWYNAQFGWVIEGFWEIPGGASIWIEQVAADPGLRSFAGASPVLEEFAPIFGTDGSPPRIAWDGRMLHNWYAVTEPGLCRATYLVYFGGPAGEPLPGYLPGEVTLEWRAGCASDFNRDWFVNGDDFDSFVAEFAAGAPGADFDGNGFVNGDDFDSFVVAFESGC